MGFEEILKSINSHTEKELQAIAASTKEEVALIMKHASDESESYAKELKQKSDSESARIIASEISKANIEAKHIIDRAVEEKLEAAMQRINSYLKDYTASEAYAKLLQKMAQSAERELGQCTIFVRKQDMKLLPGAKLSKDSFIGGLKAVSNDGAKEVDYTLESVLAALNYRLSAVLVKKIKVGR